MTHNDRAQLIHRRLPSDLQYFLGPADISLIIRHYLCFLGVELALHAHTSLFGLGALSLEVEHGRIRFTAAPALKKVLRASGKEIDGKIRV